MTEEPQILTLTQAAELLQCCRVTVVRMALRGAFPYQRVGSKGREWRFGRTALLRWVNGN